MKLNIFRGVTRMKKGCVHEVSERNVGFDLATRRKDYFCVKCERLVKTLVYK